MSRFLSLSFHKSCPCRVWFLPSPCQGSWPYHVKVPALTMTRLFIQIHFYLLLFRALRSWGHCFYHVQVKAYVVWWYLYSKTNPQGSPLLHINLSAFLIHGWKCQQHLWTMDQHCFSTNQTIYKSLDTTSLWKNRKGLNKNKDTISRRLRQEAMEATSHEGSQR